MERVSKTEKGKGKKRRIGGEGGMVAWSLFLGSLTPSQSDHNALLYQDTLDNAMLPTVW